MDLLQAEAVADLIEAVTPLQARTAFDQLNGTLTEAIAAIDEALFHLIAQLEASVDFPEEGYHFVEAGTVAASIDVILQATARLLAGAGRGRLLREGLQVTIVGPPNVGKSSLFNALAGAGRAIVTDRAGTTRDLITETIDIEGVRVTLVDTAGIRESDDVIEAEGIARARGAERVADLVLMVADRSIARETQGLDAVGEPSGRFLQVATKADLPAAWRSADCVEVSSTTGIGLDLLRQRVLQAMDVETVSDRPEISNIRHIQLVRAR